MRCPSCGFDNLTGADVCDNCGADLAGRDVPEAATSYHGPLLGEHLDQLLHELSVGDPDILDASADVDDAVQVMHANGSDCVLVVEGGRLVGIFTDRDAVLKVAGQAAAGARPLADLMTRDPVVLRHDDTIAVAINKMAVGGFRHIPIIEDGVPTGVVTARDVFRHLAASLD
jgi:CBS domain-containing protein